VTPVLAWALWGLFTATPTTPTSAPAPDVVTRAAAVPDAAATDGSTTDGATTDGATTNGVTIDDDAVTRTVAVLPFQAGRGVTTQQAQGVAARLRATLSTLGDEGSLSLLPTTKGDDKAVRRCAQEAACYADVATARGADVVVYGLVESGAGALRVIAKASGRLSAERTFAFRADDDATNRILDRVARELGAPETLRGTLTLVGQPGDSVVIDGQRRGTINRDGTYVLEQLREGRHAVEVSRTEGHNGAFYEPFVRTVTITHREKTALKVVLLPKDPTSVDDATHANGPSGLSIGAMATGGALVLGGVGAGVWSLVDAAEVTERAGAQQLVFPRDEDLVSRGRTLAVVANVLLGAGAVVGGIGAAWWALGAPKDDDASAQAAPSTPVEATP
jgi:hypothetical protein